MVCTSCASDSGAPKTDPRWRRALWIALAVNAVMFSVEIAAGVSGGSRALQGDALDFLGDAANYAISLGVARLVLTWRARAALAKGVTLALLGLFVMSSSLWAVWHGGLPHAETMGVVGLVALVANAAVAIMLFRFREGDANTRSVWICSRNDAIGNAAVVLAALGVFGTGTRWPDILVAIVMAGLGLWGGRQIIAQALGELRAQQPARARAEHRYSSSGI